MTDDLADLLAKATVRIDVGGELSGTGFVVAPGKVLTCHHVVKHALEVVAHLRHALTELAADDDAAFALEFEVRRSVAWVPDADRDLLHRAYERACHEAGKEPAPWGLVAHDATYGSPGPTGGLD